MTPAAYERMRARIPLLVVSAAAWLALVAATRQNIIQEFCSSMSWLQFSLDRLSFTAAPLLPVLVGEWTLMVLAMMMPMLGGQIGHVRARSLPRRRIRATTTFMIGYCAVWIAAGILIVGTVIIAQVVSSAPIAIAAVTWAMAFVWQCSPAKQYCLNRCHDRPPLGAHGASADLSAFKFGSMQAIWCCGTCWVLMMICLASPTQHVYAMAVVSGFVYAERLDKPRRPEWAVRLPTAALRLLRFRFQSWRPQLR